MRRLILSTACLLFVAGAASAQTKAGHYSSYTSQSGDPAQIETHGQPNAPGPAARPGAETARLGSYRGTMHPRMHHGMMRHRHGMHACMARATAHGLHGRAKSHYVQRCEVGRR